VRSQTLRRTLIAPILHALIASFVLSSVAWAASAGWPSYGATPGGTHFSPADQINAGNVGDLEQVWIHNSGDMRHRDFEKGVFSQSALQVTPILIDETLYYCSPFNMVFALDAATGEEKWRYDPKVDKFADFLPNCRGVSSWKSGKEGGCEHRIIEGTLDARLIALDAATGEPCTDFGDGGQVDVTHGLSEHQPYEYAITSPPAILGDTVITGAMVLDNSRVGVPSGVVRAYDVRTGAFRWAWNPVPPELEQLNEDGTYRSGTTNVWSLLSLDEQRNLVFAPTGNTSPDFYGGHRKGLDEYSSSVVALDGTTGERVWHFQFVHHDIWDYDTPAQPTLVDLNVDGRIIPTLVQPTKMGLTFVLNRETGEPVWPVEERPVPQDPVPGEYLSSTQPFPTHVPHMIQTPLTADDAWGFTFWDEGVCRDQIETLRNEGIYTPPSLEGSVFFPGNGGGNNWGSPAVDPRTGLTILVTMRYPSSVRLTPREECEASGSGGQQLGTPYCAVVDQLSSPLGMPCTRPPWGTLDALDLVAGKVRWSVPLGTTRNIAPFPFWWIEGTPAIGGPMLTAGGLVFVAASLDHQFRAFDVSTGEVLWQAEMPTTANSSPMTYQLANGRQYVVIASGSHWGGFSEPGDHLIAYALPE